MFTNNWFDITARANFEKYASLPNTTPDNKFLEIGCYEGQASVWLMKNTKANLTVIDTFEGGQDLPVEINLLNRFKENVEPYLKDRIEILIGTSREKLKTLGNEQYDFIYIDGSHYASDVLEDAILAFPLLKEKGIIIFDDYTWGIGRVPLLELPVTGIDAFLFVYADQLEILEKNSQCIIRKK